MPKPMRLGTIFCQDPRNYEPARESQELSDALERPKHSLDFFLTSDPVSKLLDLGLQLLCV
jgi:hypothetical protein